MCVRVYVCVCVHDGRMVDIICMYAVACDRRHVSRMSKKSEQTKLFVAMASITDVRKKMKVWFPEWKNTFLNGQVKRITVKSLTQWTASQILRFVPVVSFCHAKN